MYNIISREHFGCVKFYFTSKCQIKDAPWFYLLIQVYVTKNVAHTNLLQGQAGAQNHSVVEGSTCSDLTVKESEKKDATSIANKLLERLKDQGKMGGKVSERDELSKYIRLHKNELFKVRNSYVACNS